MLFKDNAHGKWTDYRGWFGTFIENVVQGTARDLLAAAIERFEARGIPIVLTVHDEAIAEVPVGSISEADFLAILLEAPALGRRPAARRQGLERLALSRAAGGAAAADSAERRQWSAELSRPKRRSRTSRSGWSRPSSRSMPPERTAAAGDETELADLDDAIAPLFDLVSVPLTDEPHDPVPVPPLTKSRRSSSTPTISIASAAANMAIGSTGSLRGEGLEPRGGDRADPGLGWPGGAAASGRAG